MNIGIGLPSTVPGASSADLVTWARTAERLGFSTLGTLDRVVFDNYDPIPVLAAAAAVTERIGLTTSILIGPYRGNGAILAKQLASVDRLSQGRLMVGIAVGTREDDYQATDVSFGTRGQAQDELLERLLDTWSGAAVGGGRVGPEPTQAGGPPLLIGGGGRAAIRRVIEHGAGWVAGGGDAQMFSQTAESVQTAWVQAGRVGSRRLVALGYFALGDHAAEDARRYLGDYYGFSGEYVAQVIASAATSQAGVQDTIRAFADVDCDELILFPCTADSEQVQRLAAVAAEHLKPF